MADKNALQIEVEQFIYREAAMVDQSRWQEWLQM